MKNRQVALANDLQRRVRVLTVLTVVFLAVLALAPLKWQTSEWKEIQHEFNRRAAAAGRSGVAVGIKQIWRPEINLTDRCISCHVGMGAGRPLDAGGKLFGAHSPVGHQVSRMGCTICHLGQGLATRSEDAHGAVEHWEWPMLPVEQSQAACGECHGESLHTPPASAVSRGGYLFELHGCRACHKVDGEGGTVGPDLSAVALKGYDRAWHIRHLRAPTTVVEGSRMMSFGHLSDAEIDSILVYLDSLAGAPRLVRGKALAVELGCRGCHKIDDIGGDVGPDLNEAAGKSVLAYDFSHVEGEHSIENWQRQHLREPARVAPGSRMPAYRLDEEDELALLTWMRSLRRPDVPLKQLPGRTLAARFGPGAVGASDGAALFKELCAVCHGADGRGTVLPHLGSSAPDIRNPDSLAIFTDASLASIIRDGRPGRFMPAWGEHGGGLTESQIEALVAHLRRGQSTPAPWPSVQRARVDPELGARLFANDCAGCHGPKGQGTVIGPSLASGEFQLLASDRMLWETISRGRSGTAMPAHRNYDGEMMASLIRHLRSLADDAVPRRRLRTILARELGLDDFVSYRASGSPAYGKIVFDSACAGCHGPRGQGLVGPAIANPAFLRTASDAFLAGTIILGRSGRAMRPFGQRGLVQLDASEVGDVIVYLRQLAASPDSEPRGRTTQGQVSRGGELYLRYCVGCHGERGSGRTAPALGNPAFLAAVSDGFLQATLVRGRPGTPMRSWVRGRFGFEELATEDINDIVAYIRSLER